MNYSINREAIIFLDRDREVGYCTIAYDWQSGDLYAIRPPEYRILHFIYKYEPVSKLTIRDFIKKDISADKLDEVIGILVKKRIIFVDEQ